MIIVLGGKVKKEIFNVKSVYFAEDGKLDVCFNDDRESIVISPINVYEIREN